MADDGDDAVYASILDRLERSTRRKLVRKVVKKDYRSINRHIRQASESLSALQQLKAASEHLRPCADWLPNTLQAQLDSIDQLQYNVERALKSLEKVAGVKQEKTIERLLDEEKTASVEQKVVVAEGGVHIKEKEMSYSELGATKEDTTIDFKMEKEEIGATTEVHEEIKVECGNDANSQADRSRDKDSEEALDSEDLHESLAQRRIEQIDDDADMVSLKDVDTQDNRMRAEKAVLECQVDDTLVTDKDELPCGLVRVIRDAAMCIKEEPIHNQHPFKANSEIDAPCEPALQNVDEIPVELEVFQSSDSE